MVRCGLLTASFTRRGACAGSRWTISRPTHTGTWTISRSCATTRSRTTITSPRLATGRACSSAARLDPRLGGGACRSIASSISWSSGPSTSRSTTSARRFGSDPGQRDIWTRRAAHSWRWWYGRSPQRIRTSILTTSRRSTRRAISSYRARGAPPSRFLNPQTQKGAWIDLDASTTDLRTGMLHATNMDLYYPIREFYVDMYFDALGGKNWLRLGKQQHVWGKADFFRLQDVVNPVNFADHFFIDPFDDTRIPLWSALFEHRFGDVGVFKELAGSAVWDVRPLYFARVRERGPAVGDRLRPRARRLRVRLQPLRQCHLLERARQLGQFGAHLRPETGLEPQEHGRRHEVGVAVRQRPRAADGLVRLPGRARVRLEPASHPGRPGLQRGATCAGRGRRAHDPDESRRHGSRSPCAST